MPGVIRNTRKPHWTEEEFQSWLVKQGKAEHLPVPLKKQPVSKYRNKKVTLGNDTFDSKGEAARWCELQLQERAGLITDLKRQVRIPIEVNGILICHYVCDFVYCFEGEDVWEDFKGIVTDLFTLKKKLIAACYGKEVKITKK